MDNGKARGYLLSFHLPFELAEPLTAFCQKNEIKAEEAVTKALQSLLQMQQEETAGPVKRVEPEEKFRPENAPEEKPDPKKLPENKDCDSYKTCEKFVPVWEKYTLSVDEASVYFRIGPQKLRRIIQDNPNADWILWNGTRPQIKRKLFEPFVDRLSAI